MDAVIKYFPCPTGLHTSRVWSAIVGEFGAKGGIVFLYLVCTVFKHGYFIYWDERAAKILSESTTASVGLVQHVVQRLVQLQFFDANMLKNCGVLTGKYTQSIYISQKHLTNEIANNLQYRVEQVAKNTRRFDFQDLTTQKEKETENEKENTPHTPYKEKEKEKEKEALPLPLKCLKKNAREKVCESEQSEKSQWQRTDGVDDKKRDAPSPKVFKPPSVEEIEAYIQANGITSFTASEFYYFYESKGWMVGKNKMKSWKMAVNTWVQRDKRNNASNTSNAITNSINNQKTNQDGTRNYQERLF